MHSIISMAEVEFMKSLCSIFLLSLLCSDLFGQSAAQTTTFHIRGTITDSLEAVIPGAKVTFLNEQLTTTVNTNSVGIYEADLPLGSYTMTAQVPGFRLYRRPLFRVTAPSNLILNAMLLVGNPCGDIIIVNSSGETVTADQYKAATEHCRRDDPFRIPSRDGVPFELSIRYGERRPIGSTYSYRGEKTREYETPVFVAYNLFSLQADSVIYDATTRTFQASGSVVAVDESGATRRADAMTFKIEDGRATQQK
jgi:hypothetical protein